MNIENLIQIIEAELFDNICEESGTSRSIIGSVYLYDAVKDDIQDQAIQMLS